VTRARAEFVTISSLRHQPPVGGTRICLTFDIDWAIDPVIEEAIDLVERYDVAATWFITHDTPIVERLRRNTKFEIAIHPNFNFLLEGDPRNGANAEEVVDRLIAVVPEASAVRSHSLAQSERLVDLFVDRGLLNICNFYIPHQEGRAVAPWPLWGGAFVVPHCWQDNVSMRTRPTVSMPEIAHASLNVFDFHPIHVALNSRTMDLYEQTRHLHRDYSELKKVKEDGWGTRTILEQVLEG
jgi:hypothetical protein